MTINNNEDGSDIEACINDLVEKQSVCPIAMLVFIPAGHAVVNASSWTNFLALIMSKVKPMTAVGVLPVLFKKLSEQTAEDIQSYQSALTNIYTMFMTAVSQINVINLTHAGETANKTEPNNLIARLVGRTSRHMAE